MKLNGTSSRDDLEGRALGIESRLQSIWLRVNSINLELTLLTRSNCLLPACTVNQPIVFRRGMEKRNRREANGSPTNAKGKKRNERLEAGNRRSNARREPDEPCAWAENWISRDL